MKASKLFLAGLLSLGLTSVATAKDGDNLGGFGIKGGVGFSTISFGDPKDSGMEFKDSKNSWKIGGLAGVSYEARMGKVFALDIEALFANKGVKRTETFSFLNQNGDVSLKTNLFTLDVPVSAKFYFGDNFNIYAGPYFSYILGANVKTSGSWNGNNQSKETNNWYGDDYKDVNGEYPLKRFDIGANIGLEFVTNGGFGVGARFQKGFVDLTNNDYKGSITENDGWLPMGDNKFVSNTGIQIYGIFRF